jgi:hypothetical protein
MRRSTASKDSFFAKKPSAQVCTGCIVRGAHTWPAARGDRKKINHEGTKVARWHISPSCELRAFVVVFLLPAARDDAACHNRAGAPPSWVVTKKTKQESLSGDPRFAPAQVGLVRRETERRAGRRRMALR